jgi:transposase
VTCRTLEEYYHIDGHLFEKQYKESLSGFRSWEQLDHAEEWLLFADNIGPRLAIDESSLSNGELYTFITNRDSRTREQSLVAVVAGTRSEDIIAVLKMIDEDKRNQVEEVTLDLSDSMRRIVRTAFPRASRVIDRFHIIAVRLNSTTIKIVCSTADFPRSSIFFSFPSPPNQKVMDLEVTPRRISTPFPSPFQDY